MVSIATEESGLIFCPVCANILLVRDTMHTSCVFWCRTCSYSFHIKNSRLVITETLIRRSLDDVLGGEDAWKDVAKADAKCPSQMCNSRLAFFRQLQIRSADEPMTTFYRCVKCSEQWRED